MLGRGERDQARVAERRIATRDVSDPKSSAVDDWGSARALAVGPITWRRRAKELLGIIKLLTAFSKRRPALVYDLISTNHLMGEATGFINFGYWRNAGSYDEAARAMAELVGQAAEFTSADVVLDCGFGLGDQDFFWIERFDVERIHGLNVSASQVEVARRRVRETGLTGRVELEQGSATAIRFASGAFDKVVSLEAAFHFNTREAFFREAYRVLVPGGRLVLTDMIPTPEGIDLGGRERWVREFASLWWQYPKENMYPRNAYATKLAECGFEHVAVRSIREDVLLPYERFFPSRLERDERERQFNPIIRAAWKRQVEKGIFDSTDYVLAVGDKPRQ